MNHDLALFLVRSLIIEPIRDRAVHRTGPVYLMLSNNLGEI
jgi:hypothetical protein